MSSSGISRRLEHFAYAADGKYALPLKIAVASLLHACREHPREFHVHVLDMGLSDADWEELSTTWKRLAPLASFVRHPLVAEEFRNYRVWNGSLATYARIKLPELLPDAAWCLYADCDTFFFDDPLDLERNLEDGVAMAGHLNPVSITEGGDRKWFMEKHIPMTFERYVCTGLVLLNLEWFRKHDGSRRCLEFLDRHPDSFAADQCALNYVCRNNVELLPSGWGSFSYEAIQEPVCHCIHFAGTTPWSPPMNWMFYCGEHRQDILWYRFATQVAGVPGLQRRFMPWGHTFVHRAKAAVLWPLLCAAAFLRIYPASMRDHAESIRNRCLSKAVSKMRASLRS